MVTSPGAIGAYGHNGELLWLTHDDIRLSRSANGGKGYPGSQAGNSFVAYLTNQGKLIIRRGKTGDPRLPDQELDAVYFLDTYHLLSHWDVLLPALRNRLNEDGQIFVLDRIAPEEIPHREASHRRMIAPQTVKEEMSKFAFQIKSSTASFPPARFLLVFGKRP